MSQWEKFFNNLNCTFDLLFFTIGNKKDFFGVLKTEKQEAKMLYLWVSNVKLFINNKDLSAKNNDYSKFILDSNIEIERKLYQ